MTHGFRRILPLTCLALLLAACSGHSATLGTEGKIAAPVSAAVARLEAGQPLDRTMARSDADGRLEVYAYLADTKDDPAPTLEAHGLKSTVISKTLGVAQGWILPADLSQLAALPFVKRITLPQYAVPR